MISRTFVAGLMVVAACAGCGHSKYATGLVTPQADQSLMDNLLWTDSSAARQGIDCVAFESDDGVTIDAWVIRSQTRPPLGTMVLLHGLNESKASWPYLGAGERLAKKGYDVVLPDLRAHGDSTGEHITYGVKEKHDIKSLVTDLKRTGKIEGKVYVFGVNYGADVALQYAAIDQRVQGVMAVAPHVDFATSARQQLRGLLLSAAQEDAIIKEAATIAGFDASETSALAAAAAIKCPVYLVHGLLDPIVPLDASRQILAAAGDPKRLRVMGLDQLGIVAILEDWIADEMDAFARDGLTPRETQPATQMQ